MSVTSDMKLYTHKWQVIYLFPGCSPAPAAAAVYYSVKNKMGWWLLSRNSFIHEMVHAKRNCRNRIYIESV